MATLTAEDADMVATHTHTADAAVLIMVVVAIIIHAEAVGCIRTIKTAAVVAVDRRT